jgi:hypothetical protein
MKNMRKLIPAIAMLLVSAVMMSTASFAWFSSNYSATATGMQVKATASGGIAIGGYTANSDAGKPGPTSFASTVDLSASTIWKNNTGLALVPTSFNGTDWYVATAEKVDNNAATGAYSKVTTENAYRHQKIQIKALANNSHALYVDDIAISLADTSATTAALNKSLRIAMCVEGTNWFFFAPTRTLAETTATVPFVPDHTTGTTTANYDIYTYNSADKTTDKTADKIYLGDGDSFVSEQDVVIYNTLTTDAITIDIYVYYEGEDPNCITAYAVDLVNTNITFTFII